MCKGVGSTACCIPRAGRRPSTSPWPAVCMASVSPPSPACHQRGWGHTSDSSDQHYYYCSGNCYSLRACVCQALCLRYLNPLGNSVKFPACCWGLFSSLAGALPRTTEATCGEALCWRVCPAWRVPRLLLPRELAAYQLRVLRGEAGFGDPCLP